MTTITQDVLASKGKRFANFVIDILVRYVIFFIFGFFAALIDPEGFNAWILSVSPLEDILYGLLVLMVYYIIIESLTQRSIGKYITGTKIIMEDGSKPGAGVIIKRTLCRLIPFEAFTFLGDTAAGLHDKLSNTRVVDVKKYDEALNLKNSFDEIGTTNNY
jgi:uncharacterized RDD family membrane protein YckC